MIKFKNIRFDYNGKTLIDDFSCEIERGEHIAIMGESGCGKSTLINSIVGLVAPDAGDIYIKEMGVKEENIDKIRLLTSWLPQEISLPYKSVIDLLKSPYTLKVNRSKSFNIEACIEIFNVLGLETSFLERDLVELSGGERQRVLIASTLLLDRELMLFDEPTSALDQFSTAKFASFLKDRYRDTTIVVVTHDEKLAKSFDRVITLK